VSVKGASMENLTYFWDIDRSILDSLPFGERVEWLRQRVDRTLLQPIAILEKAHTSAFVWMAITELVCAGIEALAGFYGDGRHDDGMPTDTTPFCRFVRAFMHDDFNRVEDNAKGERWTYCQHLQKYFRDGLAHGFSIEWGGLLKAGENGSEGYLRPAPDGRGIAICPCLLLEDFRHAIEMYFDKLTREGKNSLMGQNFCRRFRGILEQRSHIR
jgi:hypothetical protein